MDRQALATTLAGHTPADAAEAEHLARTAALVVGPGDPFDKERFDPGHVTASAVVLSPDLSAMLMVFHGGLRRWLQPGGHVEPGDADIAAAALREVEEETGQVRLATVAGAPPLIDVDVHAIPPKGRLPAHLHHDVRLLFRAREPGLTPGSDVHIAGWVPLDELPSRNDEASIRRIAAKIDRLIDRSR